MFDFSKPEITVPVIKAFLIENDYEENSLTGVRKADLVQTIIDDNLEDAFAKYLGGKLAPESEYEIKQQTVAAKEQSPKRGTKEWNDFVMSKFNDDERVSYKTPEGRTIEAVRADGLRRVGELVLGNILYSGPVTSSVNYSGPKGLPCANVQYKIVLEGPTGYISEFQSLGEVSYLNTEDSFLGFALLTAETRAKGRAWREALGVKTYAIEEFSGKKDTAAAVAEVSSADWKEQPITTSQQRTIKNLAGKFGLDILKLINASGKTDSDGNFTELKYVEGKAHRYDGLDDENLMNKSAAKILKALNQMQQSTLDIDKSLLLAN